MHPQNYQLIFDHKPAIHRSTNGIPWEPHIATYMPQFSNNLTNNWKVSTAVYKIKRDKDVTHMYLEDFNYLKKSEFLLK
jgi:hypothetical protein